MQQASREAFSRNHDAIGPEHVLLGVLKEGTGVTESVLKAIDRDFSRIRTLIDRFVPRGLDASLTGKLGYTGATARLLEYSQDEAATAGSRWVTPAHLLLGIFRLPAGNARQVLEQLGISANAIRHDIQYD